MAMKANRLNFPNMVDNKLQELTPPTDVYFNPYTIQARPVKPKPKSTPTPAPKTSITTSLKSIYATVHSRLKPTKPAAKPIPAPDTVPSIPAPIAETLKTEPKRNNANVKTLPQTTISLENKCQERLRRKVGGPNDTDNYTAQQRVQEIVRQKRILADMLDQHQKLQYDRKTMAVEIQGMKNYLNEIRQKLDKSLRKLNANKAVVVRPLAPAPPPRSNGTFISHVNKVNTSGGTVASRQGGPQRVISLDARLRNGKRK